MKAWSTAIFPLAIMSTLAALTFWLLHATALPTEIDTGKRRHDPDYIITQMELRKLNKQGQLQYVLTADESRHYADDDSTDVKNPKLVYLHPSRPITTITAKTAQVSSEGETVYLRDDVNLKRDATKVKPALYGIMPELTVRPEEETAFTEAPVEFTQGKSWLKGTGMQIDNRKQTYVLESQATGLFESRKSRKP